jgi:hypothetical protein
MNNVVIVAIAWLALAAHVAVGLITRRRLSDLPLMPLLNLATAACILAYWIPKWYGYLSRGITWYLSDQLLPLYALLVCVLAGLAIAGRYSGGALQWLVFGLDAVALLGAALFFTFFRINRLF